MKDRKKEILFWFSLLGVISLYIKSSPTGMAIWTGETARLIISNSSTLEDIYISQLEFRNSASMKVYVPDHANLTIDRCIFSNSVYSRPLSVFSGVNSSVSIDNSLIKNNTVAGGAAIEGKCLLILNVLSRVLA